MVRVAISSAAEETGALLVDRLKARGIYNPASKAVVCYGVSIQNMTYALNRQCMSNKVKRMVAMNAEGVRTVPWFTGKIVPPGFQFPCLARKITGHGGTDIVPVFEEKEIPWRVASGWDWFSSYVNTRTEYRVWVFREYRLGVYEKVMKRPNDYKYVGRNFRNGFDFEPCVVPHRGVFPIATAAIHALGLDFGAVDMVLGEDGLLYVLEVNTAPGVIKSGAQVTLEKLVDHIESWSDGGYQDWDCCR